MLSHRASPNHNVQPKEMHIMATNDSSTMPAEAGDKARLQAAGYLLAELASTLNAAVCVTRSAIAAGGEEGTNMLVALDALLCQAGAMADQGGAACGQPQFAELDTWRLSPSAAESMFVLEQATAAEGDGA